MQITTKFLTVLRYLTVREHFNTSVYVHTPVPDTIVCFLFLISALCLLFGAMLMICTHTMAWRAVCVSVLDG